MNLRLRGGERRLIMTKKRSLLLNVGLILCVLILAVQGCGSLDSSEDPFDIKKNETNPGMAAPHFQLNGIMYVDQGEREDELPAEYIYAGEIFNGMDNGKIYVNPDSGDQVYFWTLGWDKERDGEQYYIVFKNESLLKK